MKDNNDPSNRDVPRKPSVARLLLSTIAAAFGVQSETNRQYDFQQKSIMPFILAGVVFTVAFLFSLILIVSLIID